MNGADLFALSGINIELGKKISYLGRGGFRCIRPMHRVGIDTVGKTSPDCAFFSLL
jgi:hypothetical protein